MSFFVWIGPNKKKKKRVGHSFSQDDEREDVDWKRCQTNVNENEKSTHLLGPLIVFCMASMIYILKYWVVRTV